ncbi:MAG: hypothetical protein ACREP2_10350 [Rhodanobacteraceae bacterium]
MTLPRTNNGHPIAERTSTRNSRQGEWSSSSCQMISPSISLLASSIRDWNSVLLMVIAFPRAQVSRIERESSCAGHFRINEVLVHSLTSMVDGVFVCVRRRVGYIVQRFRFFGLFQQMRRGFAYVQLAGHHVPDQPGLVFAEKLDLAVSIGNGGAGRPCALYRPSHYLSLLIVGWEGKTKPDYPSCASTFPSR